MSARRHDAPYRPAATQLQPARGSIDDLIVAHIAAWYQRSGSPADVCGLGWDVNAQLEAEGLPVLDMAELQARLRALLVRGRVRSVARRSGSGEDWVLAV